MEQYDCYKLLCLGIVTIKATVKMYVKHYIIYYIIWMTGAVHVLVTSDLPGKRNTSHCATSLEVSVCSVTSSISIEGTQGKTLERMRSHR